MLSALALRSNRAIRGWYVFKNGASIISLAAEFAARDSTPFGFKRPPIALGITCASNSLSLVIGTPVAIQNLVPISFSPSRWGTVLLLRAGRSSPPFSARAVMPERWLGKFGQADKWRICLTAAKVPQIRSKNDETSTKDAQPRLQGEGTVQRLGDEDANHMTGRVVTVPIGCKTHPRPRSLSRQQPVQSYRLRPIPPISGQSHANGDA